MLWIALPLARQNLHLFPAVSKPLATLPGRNRCSPNLNRRERMSGPRRDSNDGTRGGPLHGRGGKSVDDNKKSGGGHGKPAGGNDDNAHPPGGGVN